jgi:hypothetical protein
VDEFERLLDLGMESADASPSHVRDDRQMILDAALELSRLGRICVTLNELPDEPLRNVRLSLAFWAAAA